MDVPPSSFCESTGGSRSARELPGPGFRIQVGLSPAVSPDILDQIACLPVMLSAINYDGSSLRSSRSRSSLEGRLWCDPVAHKLAIICSLALRAEAHFPEYRHNYTFAWSPTSFGVRKMSGAAQGAVGKAAEVRLAPCLG